MAKLDKISLSGFKSIEKLEDFELKPLNVLIGANGSGKSNFVEFFRMLRAMADQQLQAYVTRNGPADGYFYNGVGFTKRIEADLSFGDNRYVFSLEPTADGKIFVAKEGTQYIPKGKLGFGQSGGLESKLVVWKDSAGFLGAKHGVDYDVWTSVRSWEVYHFHDTGTTAGMRRDAGIIQSKSLQPDASNLAAFLLGLREKYPPHYELLKKTLQRIAPYFDDFELRVTKASPEDTVRLTWKRKGSSYIFSPAHFSDGTIRFLCLITALTQPNPPTTIVVDEPELGLHPEALAVLADLVRSASTRMQIILATQSPVLLSEFEPAHIITVDQKDGASIFRRLDAPKLDEWLQEYTLGELWQKGNIRGGVTNA